MAKKKTTAEPKPAPKKRGPKPGPRMPTVDTANIVQLLRGVGCKVTEIADYLGISVDTIERHYTGNLKKGRADLHVGLRRTQVQKALAGDGGMLRWLGMQYLKQCNKVQTDDEGSKGPPQFNADDLAALRQMGLVVHARKQRNVKEAARKEVILDGDLGGENEEAMDGA